MKPTKEEPQGRVVKKQMGDHLLRKMSRLENTLTACAVALAAVLTASAHRLEEPLELSWGLKLLIDCGIIAVCFTLLKELIAATLLESAAVRRLVLRGEFVEGTWIDVVSYPDRDPLIGIVHIGSHRSRLTYYGENLHSDGTHANQFSTEAARLDFPRLTFHYAAGGSGGERPYLAGIGAITFDLPGPAGPSRYSGHCLDAVEGVRHTLIGIRVEDPGDLVELSDASTRSATALRLAAPLLRQGGIEPALTAG
jgi:hypothetical protein